MKFKEIICKNGSKESHVFVSSDEYGTWYIELNGTIINHTTHEITEDSNLSDLEDDDCFSVSDPILSLIQFKREIRSYV